MKTSKISMLGMLLAITVGTQSAVAFYNPQTGRWLSRDPIEEKGGLNLSAIIDNCVLQKVDYLGLRALSCREKVDRALQKRKIVKLLEEINKRGCRAPKIEALECCDTLGEGVGGKYTREDNTLRICCSAENIETVVYHEMIHALDVCRGTGEDCDSHICGEIVAYYDAGCEYVHPRVGCAISKMLDSIKESFGAESFCMATAKAITWSDARNCLKDWRDRNKRTAKTPGLTTDKGSCLRCY